MKEYNQRSNTAIDQIAWQHRKQYAESTAEDNWNYFNNNLKSLLVTNLCFTINLSGVFRYWKIMYFGGDK